MIGAWLNRYVYLTLNNLPLEDAFSFYQTGKTILWQFFYK